MMPILQVWQAHNKVKSQSTHHKTPSEISHLSLEKVFEVAHCADLLADGKLHVKAEINLLLRIATKVMDINGKFEERLNKARFAWLQRYLCIRSWFSLIETWE
jgi:hypothetical protein